MHSFADSNALLQSCSDSKAAVQSCSDNNVALQICELVQFIPEFTETHLIRLYNCTVLLFTAVQLTPELHHATHRRVARCNLAWL